MIKRNMIISCALAIAITGGLGQTANATTNCWKQSNGGWLYYQNNSLKTGWIQDSGKWYYLNTSTGIMQVGWVNDGGTWYYLDSSGAMLSNTTVEGYYLGTNGAWIASGNSGYTQGKDPEEIKKILKDKYGFVDYNQGVLLRPYSADNARKVGDYINDQIVYNYFNNQYMNAIKLGIYKNDAETTRIAKEIFNMIFPNKGDEAYSITTDFYNSGEQDKTITFCGKNIQLRRSSSYSFGISWQINL